MLPTIFALVLRSGQEIPLRRPYKLRPDGLLMMLTPRKRVRTPVNLSSAIEAAIAKEIVAPPRKRARLSPPSASPPSPLPSPSRKRSRSPSPPPLPLPSLVPSDMLLPRKRFRMTLLQTEATEETFEETADETLTKTTTPSRLSRLIHHEGQIEEIYDHLREVSLERIETLELEVETLRDRAEIAEQRTKNLQDALGRARDEIFEHQFHHEATKARLQ
ncbi:hypothetical protein Tco_1456161 [Tanacetum coccineum]